MFRGVYPAITQKRKERLGEQIYFYGMDGIFRERKKNYLCTKLKMKSVFILIFYIMKKLFVLALAALMTFAACSDEDDNSGNGSGEVSLDGRWNALRNSDHPDDYAFSLIFNGDKLDLYIIAWGQHYEGTYTYANNNIAFNISKVYQAYTNVTFDEDGKIDGYSWGAGNMDQTSFRLAQGYDWYLMNGYEDYENFRRRFSSFEFRLDGSTKAYSNLQGIENLVFNKASR